MQSQIFINQVYVLTRANLKSRYRNTIAGFIWVIMNPLLMFGAQSLVFRKFLQLNVPNYYLFLLSGLLPWIFLVQNVEMCTGIFVNSRTLLKAFPTHPAVYLTAQILDNLINFLAAFFILLLGMAFFAPYPAQGIPYLVFPIIFLTIAATAISWFLATLQVFFRDTRFIVTFVMSIAFYLTPVFYPIAIVPEKYHWVIAINPFARLITPFRDCIYDFNLKTLIESSGAAFVTCLCFIALAGGLWKLKKNAIYFKL